MYPNFEAERARANLTLDDLTKKIGGTVGSLSNKLRGVSSLSFSEAVELKKAVGTDVPLEELFSKRESEV